MNTHVHLVIPDLLLPHEAAMEACASLRLPALEKILARATTSPLPALSLEDWLCGVFGAESQAIAPITLQADGGYPGTAYWLRADPVHLIFRGEQFILRPVVTLDADEAAQFCAGLNRHFSAEGLHFEAPQPQHWYVRLDKAPELAAHSLAQAAGRDIRAYLPQGADALRWHKLLNEIQMLLFDHPVNQAREARGDWLINSLWLWGGGHAPEKLLRPFVRVYTDCPLPAAFAEVAGIHHSALPGGAVQCLEGRGEVLIVCNGLRQAWQHGDLAAWRDSVQQLEQDYAAPLLQALRGGRIERITLDAIGAHASRRFVLTRGMTWQFWHFSRRLDGCALV
jgi:hypothetical protein